MIENKREQKGWHMRKEILPEMFNYNKYPGPDFVYVADLLKSDACQFTVLENHKDALDATRFGQRFSEIMLKYDYIVGDWSNDQLRLKGFYEDERPNTRKTDRISRLSEYLREYCAFGCAYFILKNEEPQLIVFEEETEPRRKRRRSNNRRHSFQESRDREHNASQKNKGQKASAKQKPDKSKRRDRDQEGPNFEKIKRRPKFKSRSEDGGRERKSNFKKSQKQAPKSKGQNTSSKKQSQTKSDGQHFTIRKKGN